MKSKTKWGVNNQRDSRVIFCPKCKAVFVNRKKQGCPKCGVKLYAGSEWLWKRDGFWWHPKKGEWITVKSMYEKLEVRDGNA